MPLRYYLLFVAYGMAAVLYLCVSFALIRLFRSAERKWLAYLRLAFMDKLIVEDLHKKFGDNEVLKGVSLRAQGRRRHQHYRFKRFRKKYASSLHQFSGAAKCRPVSF